MKRTSLSEAIKIINDAFDNLENSQPDSIEDFFVKQLIELISDTIDTINTFLTATRSEWQITQFQVDLPSRRASFDMYNDNLGLGMKVSFIENFIYACFTYPCDIEVIICGIT